MMDGGNLKRFEPLAVETRKAYRKNKLK